MGAIGGMLGTAGGAAGTGFKGPESVNLVNPVNGAQLSQADIGVNNSMQSQQQLLQALQGQNGIGNQSQVYNQLQGIANGTGPNPAMAQLNQTTGANVANQAALMAGQRGASSNVGLMARQAAQVGGNIQQQAVGQGATMQANQSLNAINAAGGIAGQQVNNQVGQTNANTNAQQAYQQNLLGAQAQYNNAQMGLQSNINTNNTALVGNVQKQQGDVIGGLAKGAAMAAAAAGGGMITKYADGGDTSFQAPQQPAGPQSKFGQFLKGSTGAAAIQPINPQGGGGATGGSDLNNGIADATAALGKGIKKQFATQPDTNPQAQAAGAPNPTPNLSVPQAPVASPNSLMADGGMVPALLSPGEKYLAPKEVEEVAKGKANPAQVGKIVPGKPKFKGNNYANDVVPAKLKEGGVVIPNSIMQSKDPARGAADFVNKIMAKRRNK